MTGAPYNFHFDICAIVLLVLILVVIFCKKRLYIRINTLFLLHIVLMIANSGLGIVCGMINEGMIPCGSTGQTLWNALDGFEHYLSMLNYILYLFSLACLCDFKKWHVRAVVVLFWILAVAAFVSPFFGQVTWITSRGEYSQGVLYWLSEAVLYLAIFAATLAVVKFGTRLSFRKRCFVAMSNALIMVSFVVQDIWQFEFCIMYPIFAFMALFYFLVLQSPDFYMDIMTGLFNQKAFMEVLQENVSYKKPVNCLLVCIDDYDSLLRVFRYDHLTAVRKNLADILRDTAKQGKGTIYRMSSSTFAVVCQRQEWVKRLYELYLSYLPKRWEIEDEVIGMEYCYYQLEYNGDDTEFEKLAQWVRYAHSNHGSSQKPGELVELKYDIMMETEKQREVLHRIEEAILDQSMEIHMQPVYSIEKKRITSLEVLSRMKDKEQKYINPEYFIHIAEKNHRILQLGELIFRRACIFASQNHIFDLGIEYMNVNISPGQCQYERLTEDFVKIAAEYDIPVERIHLEITESEFQDPEAVERTLARLRKSGMEVALDDFGTGCSTLLSILELPLDYVKIDKSLVWSYDTGDNRFLDDLMPVIKAEGKKVIAEGIETEDHIEILRRLQGDYLQGYYFSKPLPEREFVKYVRDFNKVEVAT